MQCWTSPPGNNLYTIALNYEVKQRHKQGGATPSAMPKRIHNCPAGSPEEALEATCPLFLLCGASTGEGMGCYIASAARCHFCVLLGGVAGCFTLCSFSSGGCPLKEMECRPPAPPPLERSQKLSCFYVMLWHHCPGHWRVCFSKRHDKHFISNRKVKIVFVSPTISDSVSIEITFFGKKCIFE